MTKRLTRPSYSPGRPIKSRELNPLSNLTITDDMGRRSAIAETNYLGLPTTGIVSPPVIGGDTMPPTFMVTALRLVTDFTALTALPTNWSSGAVAPAFEANGTRLSAAPAGDSFISSPMMDLSVGNKITVEWLAESQNSQPAVIGDPNLYDVTDAAIWANDGNTDPTNTQKKIRVILERISQTALQRTYYTGPAYTQVQQNTVVLGAAEYDNFHIYVDAVHEDVVLQRVVFE